MTNKRKKNKELPRYLTEKRNQLIIELDKFGFSFREIADLLSVGLSRSRIHQIIQEAGSKGRSSGKK